MKHYITTAAFVLALSAPNTWAKESRPRKL